MTIWHLDSFSFHIVPLHGNVNEDVGCHGLRSAEPLCRDFAAEERA